MGLAVGSGVGEADGSTLAEGDGTGDDVPLTSASTLQFRRSSSIRPWMDCSLRTMSSSCCRFTAESAGPTSLKIVATSWASLITRTQAALTRHQPRWEEAGPRVTVSLVRSLLLRREIRRGGVQQADDQDTDSNAGNKSQYRDPPTRSSPGGYGIVIGGLLFCIGASHLAPPRMERLDDLQSGETG